MAYTAFNAARTLSSLEPSDFRVERLGALYVSVDTARPTGYCNRILGLAKATLDQLDAALQLHERNDVASRVDVETADAVPDVRDALHARGFSPTYALAYLDTTTPSAEPPTLPADTVIERWSAPQVDQFFDLLEEGGAPIAARMRDARRKYYCTDTFRTYVALVRGKPAAHATMYVRDGSALLANARTDETFRRRGLHGALLQTRLHEAARLGLDWLLTDVVTGTASERNCRRAGLEPFAEETVWERPDAAETG